MAQVQEQEKRHEIAVPANKKLPAARGVGFWLFVAFAAVYVLSTHGRVTGMGYESEVYLTAKQLVERGDVSLYGSGIDGNPRAYGRNDLTQPLLVVPFYLVSRLVPAGSAFAGEWLISLFNPLVSAAIVYLIYCFAMRLSASRRTAVVIAVLGGLGTIIWPYAVIGMEPVQTLLALATVYCAYMFRRHGSAGYLLTAGLTLGLLFQAKRGSVILVPALLLYLAFVALERYRSRRDATVGGIVVLTALLAASTGGSLWLSAIRTGGVVDGAMGGQSGFPGQISALFRDAGWIPGGLYGFLFSAGKSYFLYNPPALLGLLAFPTFLRHHRAEALLFAGLLLTPYFFYSTLWWWSDETWGPRYLHSTVPFALLFLGALDWSRLRGAGWRVALGLSLALGMLVQILGILFWYGRYFQVLNAAKLNTIQNIQFDPQLSNIWVNALLAWSAFSSGVLGRPVFLDYQPRYWFTPPPGYEQVAQPRHLDLQPYHEFGMWFPTTLANSAVPAGDRIVAALLVLLLFLLLAFATVHIGQAIRGLDERDNEPLVS